MLAFAIVISCAGTLGADATASAATLVRLTSPPSDLAFDAHDTLYVASAVDETIHRVGAAGVETVGAFPGVFGIASALDGGVCAGHLTDAEPLFRTSRISCLLDGAWHTRVEGVGSGVHGLAASSAGLWLAAWLATDVESRNGLVALTRESSISQETHLRELVPQYVAPRPAGGAFVSAWREDADGFREGVVVSVTEDGYDIWTDRPHQPTGVLVTEEGLWIADRARGTLSLFTLGGSLIRVVDGFVSPMGLALSTEHGICVAEEDARRIRCFDPASSPGGTP